MAAENDAPGEATAARRPQAMAAVVAAIPQTSGRCYVQATKALPRQHRMLLYRRLNRITAPVGKKSAMLLESGWAAPSPAP